MFTVNGDIGELDGELDEIGLYQNESSPGFAGVAVEV